MPGVDLDRDLVLAGVREALAAHDAGTLRLPESVRWLMAGCRGRMRADGERIAELEAIQGPRLGQARDLAYRLVELLGGEGEDDENATEED